MAHCFNQPNLLPFEQAKQNILNSILSKKDSELVTIDQAIGRVLSSKLLSPVNVPPCDNSAMDGYAFSAHSLRQSKEGNHILTLVGKVFAGAPFQGSVGKGECVRIMTGGKVPTGCDTVEMQENTVANGTSITFNHFVKYGKNVRRCGEDISQSACVMQSGHKLTSADIGTLASIGIATVQVVKKIKVALIATGDELKEPSQFLSEGDIYESNRFFLKAMLEKLPVEVIDFGVIPDDHALITQAFQEANKQADVIISSGGVSVGEADYTKQVLDELGHIGFWKIAMKPGKPFAFGQLSESTFFGLPGNPVSALVTFYQLVVPALYQFMNTSMPKRIKLLANSTTRLNKSSGRMDFHRGIWQLDENGAIEVTSTGSQSSGMLSSIAQANCFILLTQHQGNVAAGEQVTIELFDELLS